jgi:hypothetical protein
MKQRTFISLYSMLGDLITIFSYFKSIYYHSNKEYVHLHLFSPTYILFSYEAEFVKKLLWDNNKKLAVSFNHTFRYINDVLSINNHKFHNYVHLIYRYELEIKDTTKSDKSASYLDILLNIESNMAE